MTNAEKRALVDVLLTHIGNITEFWDEVVRDNPDLGDISSHDAAKQFSKWLKHLPGDTWDSRRPFPS